MGKLEEIARAICEASGKSWRTGTFTALTGTDTVNNKMTWEEHDLDAYNNHWRHIALAAVKAMREPTQAMIDSTGNGECSKWARGAYQLYIDAIIAEAEQEGE